MRLIWWLMFGMVVLLGFPDMLPDGYVWSSDATAPGGERAYVLSKYQKFFGLKLKPEIVCIVLAPIDEDRVSLLSTLTTLKESK